MSIDTERLPAVRHLKDLLRNASQILLDISGQRDRSTISQPVQEAFDRAWHKLAELGYYDREVLEGMKRALVSLAEEHPRWSPQEGNSQRFDGLLRNTRKFVRALSTRFLLDKDTDWSRYCTKALLCYEASSDRRTIIFAELANVEKSQGFCEVWQILPQACCSAIELVLYVDFLRRQAGLVN